MEVPVVDGDQRNDVAVGADNAGADGAAKLVHVGIDGEDAHAAGDIDARDEHGSQRGDGRVVLVAVLGGGGTSGDVHGSVGLGPVEVEPGHVAALEGDAVFDAELDSREVGLRRGGADEVVVHLQDHAGAGRDANAGTGSVVRPLGTRGPTTHLSRWERINICGACATKTRVTRFSICTLGGIHNGGLAGINQVEHRVVNQRHIARSDIEAGDELVGVVRPGEREAAVVVGPLCRREGARHREGQVGVLKQAEVDIERGALRRGGADGGAGSSPGRDRGDLLVGEADVVEVGAHGGSCGIGRHHP